MKKYNITMKFSGGDEIFVTVEADNGGLALKKAKETNQYKSFVEEHFGEAIESTIVEPIRYKPKDNIFYLSDAPNKSKWYYVDCEAAGIRLEFKKGKFDTYKTAWMLHGKTEIEPTECSTAVQEIRNWLQEYFPEMITEAPKAQIIPRNEGIKPGRENKPNAKTGTVPCYFSLKPHVAEFIKEQSKIYGMSQGEFIEWMMTEDEE